ncbi:MAG: hypothetical protein REI11_14715 [Patulibacter sp.]|nr:hypothetical protein [Patulibacter sp.]
MPLPLEYVIEAVVALFVVIGGVWACIELTRFLLSRLGTALVTGLWAVVLTTIVVGSFALSYGQSHPIPTSSPRPAEHAVARSSP